MKTLRTVILWAVGIVALCLLMGWAEESDRQRCEVDVAHELGTTAKYVNGHCMVKGYGRYDGR